MEGDDNNPFSDREAAGAPEPSTGNIDELNPYASPVAVHTQNILPPVSEIIRGGLPWEEDGRSLKSFIKTVIVIITSPRVAFESMRQTGGYGDPLIFALIGCIIGAMVVLVGQFTTGDEPMSRRLIIEIIVGHDQGFVGRILWQFAVNVFLPMVQALLYGGIFHFFLWMFGGRRQPMETTARVLAYTQGAMYFALAVPVPMVRALFSFYLFIVWIIGIRYAHETTTGKAVAAVLVPLFLIITVGGVIGFMLIRAVWKMG